MDPREQKYGSESRRDFLKMTAVIPLALSLGGFRNGEAAVDTSQKSASQSAAVPWYRRTYRWGRRAVTDGHDPSADKDCAVISGSVGPPAGSAYTGGASNERLA